MANYTPNYGLHQWEPGDNFLRTDFNQDFAKIDTAIKALETATDAKVEGRVSPEQLAQALSVKLEAVLGSYTGDGERSQRIVLGYQPKFVAVMHSKWGMAFFFPGSGGTTLWVNEDGFQALNSTVNDIHYNTKGVVYRYLLLK